MVKNKKPKKVKKEKRKKKIKGDTKTKKTIKKAKASKTKVLKGSGRTLSLENREIWKKNMVLVVFVILLAILNGWLYLRGRKIDESTDQLAKQQESPRIASVENANDNAAPADNMDGLSEQEKKIIQDLLDKKELESWKDYKNTAYSFMLKYPSDWPEPVAVKPEKGQKYKFKVSFRNAVTDEKEQKGFDIYIYRLLKSKSYIQPDYTDNLIKKDTVAEDYSNCSEIGTASIGKNKYPAMEMYHLQNDPCFSEAYFLVLEKGAYIFDVVPVPQGGVGYDGYDGRRKVAETLPEFGKMLNSFNFIQVAARRTTVVRRITAPKPLAKTRIVGGKRMCANKNDKPRKSKTNHGKHMDMECCLDPDEYPNPWCSY
ncbi:MAG: hypothetical protein V1690_01535 [Candidatus Moraniibacteriota bacterium]